MWNAIDTATVWSGDPCDRSLYADRIAAALSPFGQAVRPAAIARFTRSCGR